MSYFKDRAEYYIKIQNPATRSNDPNELIDGAKAALVQFDDFAVRSSALCVLLYRHIEANGRVDVGTMADLLDIASNIRAEIENIDQFEYVRWYLSLGLVMAAVYAQARKFDNASDVLSENIKKIGLSSNHGQPVTNVVKSLAALIGILKYAKVDERIKKETFDSIQLFSTFNNEIFKNYKYGNQWVFEELALVYSLMYEIAKLAKLIAKDNFDEQLKTYADSKIPVPFRAILMQMRGDVRS